MNAHTTITTPIEAPSADAPLEMRQAWCVMRVSALTADDSMEALPDDVRASQHFETELNYCKLDPQEYDRQTRVEG